MAKLNQETTTDEATMTPRETKTITQADITDADVLCGKLKFCVSHPGSLNFRAVIDKYASKYQEAITKQEKMNVTKEIYDSLGSQNSRFLKLNEKTKCWEELSSLLARDKISHALRFANREKKSSSSSSSSTKHKKKKGHRRNDSDSSNTTLSTVATELSLDDFEDMMLDDEPLDWTTTETGDNDEAKPYAYEIPFDSMPAPSPVYPHSYGSHYYHQPYGHPPQPYYHPHHYQPYPHYGPSPTAAAPQHHYEEHRYEEQIQVDAPMNFPEKQDPEPPTRESSMDVDLSYIMSEPLIEWDPNTDSVYTVNEQQ